MSGPCPCGSGEALPACCGRFLVGAPAPTAEALMRSRYTAFVLQDTGYLLRTWDASTRPASLEPTPGLRWLRLVVLAVTAGGPFDDEGTVEFEAVYRHEGRRGAQHETSRFVRRDGRWSYVMGI